MTLTTLPELIQGKDVARFRKFIPDASPADCWPWQSTISTRGYGKFWLAGRTDLAHRVSYKIHNGEIPVGLMVRHTCDNPPCVNPAHLIVGTGKQNARDALDRGRYRRGDANGNARLTNDEVGEIKRRLSLGETQVSLARRFGVSRAAIQWLIQGKTWRGIGDAS